LIAQCLECRNYLSLESVAGFRERGWLSLTPPEFCRGVLEKVSLRKFVGGQAIFHAGDPPGGLWGLGRRE
jgi:hypothetical protein